VLVVSQLVNLLNELPTYQHNVRENRSPAQSNGLLIGNAQEFWTVSKAATHPMEPQSSTGEQPVAVEVVERRPQWDLSPWLGGVPPLMEVMAGTGLIIVLVIYSLIFREDLRSRALSLVGKGHLTLTTKALDDAGRRISRYLFAQFILNAAFGLAIGIGLTLIGIPHAFLWGFCAGVLRYVPFVGPWLAAVFPLSMSLLVSDGWLQPVLVVGLFVVLELSNNLVIEPWAFGQSIGVSQAAILVAIAFWAWLWGPVGLMLAAPLTVCLVVLGKYVPSLKFFDVLLGDEPVMSADVNLYQRLLARDEDEAAEIISREAETLSPVELCDQLLIPTLVHARHDAESDQLTEAEFEYIHAALRELLPDTIEPRAAETAGAATEGGAPEGPPRPPLQILGCAARDAADATALEMLALQLDPQDFRLEQVTSDMLVSEVLEEVERRQPSVICVVSLPRGGMSHTRHLCKRLRQRFPKLKIVVGRWGAALTPELRDHLADSGADYTAVTLQQTCEQLDELSQFLRPAVLPSAEGTHLRTDGAHMAEQATLATAAGS
jgi:predicted PurR-regulated permease PerM